MFRFTIRDVLWLTVVVAAALTLRLGWSRETAALRHESAAREAKLRDEVTTERANIDCVRKIVSQLLTDETNDEGKQRLLRIVEASLP